MHCRVKKTSTKKDDDIDDFSDDFKDDYAIELPSTSPSISAAPKMEMFSEDKILDIVTKAIAKVTTPPAQPAPSPVASANLSPSVTNLFGANSNSHAQVKVV